MALRRAFFVGMYAVTAASCAGIRAPAGPDGGGPGGPDGATVFVQPDAPAYDFGAAVEAGHTEAGPTDLVVGSKPLGDAACAVESQKAERLPLDIYIMLDSSDSMRDPTMQGISKWDAVRNALEAFLQDQGSAGIGVGLQYFPITRPGVPAECEATAACGTSGPCDILNTCTGVAMPTACQKASDCAAGASCVRLGLCSLTQGPCIPVGSYCGGGRGVPRGNLCQAIGGYCDARDSCDPTSYATPAVEVAPLPGAAPALIASLMQHMPDGLTPTAGALSGAIAHAQSLAKAANGHQVVVLLATDGFPSECTPNDIPGVAKLASGGLAGTPSTSTFVIGVFSPDEAVDAQTNLDALAAAGGTKKAFVINISQNVTQQFVAALNAIRTAALSCQFKVPVPKPGETLDYFKVNVQYTSGAGQTVTIGNVPNRAACSATKGGWYYDADPNVGGVPQNITICDTTCSQLRADAAGRVDVLLGCRTELIIP
jgi:hypothetical protein